MGYSPFAHYIGSREFYERACRLPDLGNRPMSHYEEADTNRERCANPFMSFYTHVQAYGSCQRCRNGLRWESGSRFT